MKRKESDNPRDWFAKAEKDRMLLQRAIGEEQLAELVCFHAQQCAEKYLKGYLKSKKKSFRWSHDLRYLVTLCTECDADFDQMDVGAENLTRLADPSRYPVPDELPPTLEDARKAVEIAERIRTFVLSKTDSGQGG